MKLVSKRLTRKSFYKPTHLVGWDPAVSAEHKHQLQRSKSFHGTLEELFDPKMSLQTHDYFLVSRRPGEKDCICVMLFPPVYTPDCLQLTSIYLMPIMSSHHSTRKGQTGAFILMVLFVTWMKNDALLAYCKTEDTPGDSIKCLLFFFPLFRTTKSFHIIQPCYLILVVSTAKDKHIFYGIVKCGPLPPPVWSSCL